LAQLLWFCKTCDRVSTVVAQFFLSGFEYAILRIEYSYFAKRSLNFRFEYSNFDNKYSHFSEAYSKNSFEYLAFNFKYPALRVEYSYFLHEAPKFKFEGSVLVLEGLELVVGN